MDLFIAAMLAGLAFLLLLQMILAYVRTRNLRLLLLAGGFTLFFVEGALLLALQGGMLQPPSFSMSREMAVISLFIVLLLYAGTVKR